MAAWEHGGGFSVAAAVRIEAHERDGLERLLRYCARPAFALEHLREIDPEHLVYESVKPGPGGSVSLMLTPMQLLDRLAALIPAPRRHRHRTCGVLAPNSPALCGHRAGAVGGGYPCSGDDWRESVGGDPGRAGTSPGSALCLGAAAGAHL